jgi:hypothetical protein
LQQTKLRTQVNGGCSDVVCGDLLVIWCFDVMLDINTIHGCIFSRNFCVFWKNSCFESVGLEFMVGAEIYVLF